MVSYGKLGLSIFLSLTLSSLVVGATFKLWIEHDARTLAAQLEAEAIATAKEMERQAQLAAQERERQERSRKRAQAKRDAIRAQKQRTCNFWNDQYNKTRASYDKAMRDSACR